MATGILCSGGDAAGMNPAIKVFAETLFDRGETPYLIYDGLDGMIDGTIEAAHYERLAGILHQGGTIIRSGRSKRFFEYAFRKQAYEQLQAQGITRLIVLGGDGSFRALNQFYEDFNVPFVGIPTTIDNDIYGTEYCLGVDTALNIIRDAIDDIRDTAASFKRAFVIETMGRDCGYLALISALTSGAEICVIPEAKNDLQALKTRLRHEISLGRRYMIIVVAEGTGLSQQLLDFCNDELEMEARTTILGHIQRGGNPTVHDRLMAYEFVRYSLEYLDNNSNAHDVIVYNGGKFDFLDIQTVSSNRYTLPQALLSLAEKMLH